MKWPVAHPFGFHQVTADLGALPFAEFAKGRTNKCFKRSRLRVVQLKLISTLPGAQP